MKVPAKKMVDSGSSEDGVGKESVEKLKENPAGEIRQPTKYLSHSCQFPYNDGTGIPQVCGGYAKFIDPDLGIPVCDIHRRINIRSDPAFQKLMLESKS